MSNLAARNY